MRQVQEGCVPFSLLSLPGLAEESKEEKMEKVYIIIGVFTLTKWIMRGIEWVDTGK